MTDAWHTQPGEAGDLVDEQDRVVGVSSRATIRKDKLLHRGVAVLCRNSKDEIYVHRRTLSKDVFPGMYDMFVAGLVASGESYELTARRELAEELGIVGPDPTFLFKYRYRGRDNPAWFAVFEVRWDGPLRPQPEEIAWGAFMPEADLLQRLSEWKFVPDGLEAFRLYLDGK